MTLDDALIRFCEQSTVSDYVDSKNRQNVSSISEKQSLMIVII